MSTTTLDQLATVREFDAYLGDAADADAVMSESTSVRLDEASAFPHLAVDTVDAWSLFDHYVPAEHGGALTDALTSFLLIRHIARRDVTVAVAHGKTFLGAACSWVAGGESAARMARLVRTGAPVSWGLTEQGRGSDIARSQAAVDLDHASPRLDGGKWPINNATRGKAMTVLARSSDRPGPRSLSLVLVVKDEVDAHTLSYEPKVATHGIRGADISGIRFADTPVTAADLVGAPGTGLETVLKALQLTRPMTAALSLGAADHGLAIALDFAAGRTLFGQTLAELPLARRTLAAAVADVLLAECVSFVGARSVHAAPEQMALVSSLVKFLVPDTIDRMFRDLTSFLGARSQLVAVDGAGAFQKAARDNRVVGIFDGNSVVNLNVIINELAMLTRPAPAPLLDDLIDPLRAAAPVAPLDTTRLRLVTRHGAALLRALPDLVAAIEASGASRPVVDAARAISTTYARVLADAASAPREAQPSPAAFHLAEQIALAYGAAAAIAVALARAGDIAEPFSGDDAWLAAVLQRVAQRLRVGALAPDVADRVVAQALGARAAGRPVSLLADWSTR